MQNPPEARTVVGLRACSYAYYFTTLMDGIKPRPGSLVLRRIIINGLPDMSGAPGGGDDQAGCRPYLQLFQCGKLLYSSTWAHADAALGDAPSDPADAFRYVMRIVCWCGVHVSLTRS